MTFPTTGKADTWGLPLSLVAELKTAFPHLDIIAEASKARAWCIANQDRRKTPRGMPKFLYAWMERAQNGNGQRTQAKPPIERERAALKPDGITDPGWSPRNDQERRSWERRKELQAQVQLEHPDWQPRDIGREAGRRWKAEGLEAK